MLNDDDLGWFAGLADAEACFHVGMNGNRKNNVVALFQVGLVRCDVMERVRQLVGDIVTGPVPELHARPATAMQREFYTLTVAAKQQALALVEALQARLHGKRIEALISRDILKRAVETHYTATDRDRELCDLSHRIKKGDALAKERAALLVGYQEVPCDPSDAWLAGTFDGDGSICMIRETRGDATYHSMIVSVSSSDRPAIESLRSAVAMNYAVTAMATKRAEGGARPNHSFNIGAEDIERFLTVMRPHLRVKTAEADVLLDVCRGAMSREDAHPILRALKKADDPDALLDDIAAGESIPSEPQRTSRADKYRRPTYDEMEKRGWWSADQARQQLGGIRHAAWVRITSDLEPSAIIGNKKYYAPTVLREHVIARLNRVVRTDARVRMERAMESWELAA